MNGLLHVSTILGVMVLGGCRGAPSPLTETEVAAIADTITTLAAVADGADSRADCEAGLTVLGDREPLVVSGGNIIRGLPEMEELCAGWSGGERRAGFDIARSDVHVLSPETAYIVREGIYTIEYADPDRAPLRIHLVETGVWVREDGAAWKKVHHHESSRPVDGG